MAAPGWAATTAAGRYTSPHPAAANTFSTEPQAAAAVHSVCCSFSQLPVSLDGFTQLPDIQSKTSILTLIPFELNLTDFAELVVHYHSYFELASVLSCGRVQPMCNVFPNCFLFHTISVRRRCKKKFVAPLSKGSIFLFWLGLFLYF